MEPVNSYIRTQGINCAAINMVLNPVVTWLSNRQMEFTPLSGGGSIVVDTAVTSIILSLLVAFGGTSGSPCRATLPHRRIFSWVWDKMSTDSNGTAAYLSMAEN